MITAIQNIPNSNSLQAFKGKKIPTNFTSLYIPEEPHITAEMRASLESGTGFSTRLKNKIAEKLNAISDMNLPDARDILAKDGSIFHILPDGSLVRILSDGTVMENLENLQDFQDILPKELLLNTHKIGELTEHIDTIDMLKELAQNAGDTLDVVG